MSIKVDFNELAGFLDGTPSKSDLQTIKTAVDNRIAALGAPLVAKTAQQASGLTVSDLTTFINKMTNVEMLRSWSRTLATKISEAHAS
jgi:hypothetical protein